jgi:ornithine carbamoyltransferase
MSHLLSIRDLDKKHVLDIFKLTAELKTTLKAGRRVTPLAGRTLALIFEKPSLRTRVTFEVAMVQLGGAAVYLSAQDIGPGKRESVPDIARNLSRWVDGIAARVFAHTTLEELARHATIPVINALSDLEHPCQAMADLYTLWERGIELRGLELAWVGDGNNVFNSLLLLSALMGVRVRAACPPGYEPAPAVLAACRALGGQLRLTTDAREAAEGADLLYTDVWVSMGQEAEREKRLEAFQRYQLNDTLLGFASPKALVMHCLPAHRGEEITDAILDGPRSIVFDQAENRLHVQKGIVMHLSGAAA